MKFISLFTGIGGLDLGLERAGMECVFQVERDPFCVRVLEKHWPEVPRHDDITTLDTGSLPPADLVVGGFPCQPVSQAGKQAAQDDARWLWPEFARVLRDVRPRYALLENVPGLLTAQGGRAAQEVFGDLAELGFDADWASVPAAAVGAPHLRYRVLIVAHANGDPSQPHGAPGQLAGSASSDQGTGRERQRVRDVADGGRQDVAHTNGSPGGAAGGAGETVFRSSPLERPGRRGGGVGEQWLPEPDVGRVAHGVPDRVDRLRALGNAVVPQVAEYVGRCLIDSNA